MRLAGTLPFRGTAIGRVMLLSGALAACLPAVSAAQGADNVLVVINETSQASVQIGEYYARARSIAQMHVLRIKAPITDSIQRADYQRAIEAPITNLLVRHNMQDRILYIVLTKGVPLRISGSDGREGTVASVDSELTLLYQRLSGSSPPVLGRVPNPYFLGDRPISDAVPFTRFNGLTYLVTRLDGYTVDDVLKLIDRSVAPATTGTFVLDQRASMIERTGGDLWLKEAADRIRLATSPDRVALESTRALAPKPAGPVMGYFSWGSNDAANRLRQTGMTFAPGAIGGMFVSTDGRTFAEPPADWAPGPSKQPLGLFGSGSQSMAADLLHEGLTGVSAHVAEPYLDAVIRPQVLFPAYLAGYNLAEAYYLAMPYLSWQTVIVGDPLCRPFPGRQLRAEEISKGIDPETDLPALLTARRLENASKLRMNTEAMKLVLKAEAASLRGDEVSMEPLLVKATELEPRLTPSQIILADLYTRRGEHAKAIDRYRRIVAVDPQNAVALNNLAYALAVYDKKPAEALPIAQLAYNLAPVPVIADTLAWTHHLLGDNRSAAPLIEKAVAGLETNAELFLHAAIIHAALDDVARAKVEIDKAEQLDPKLKEQPEVIALRAKLKGK
jgi:uncharacterized protein (TIGR03790 family)